MKSKILHIILIICGLFFLSSCMKDNMHPITAFNTADKGVFIICEGNFMYGNASLSYYDINNKTVDNTVFLKANGIPLGDVAYSLTIYESTAYIVINNSGTIYAIDINTFKIKGVIKNLVSPRHIRFISPSKAYVSDLYSKSITVINPKNFEITGSINLNLDSINTSKYSSEQILLYGNYLITNSWSYDDMILLIDTNEDIVIDSIKVLPQPRRMVLDRYNKIWVLCDGGFQGSSFHGNAGIVKIDAETMKVEETFIFGKDCNPVDMTINFGGDTIYFINEHVYRFSVIDNRLPATEYIASQNRNLHSIGISPLNSDLYLADAIDYMQAGVVYRYNSKKEIIDSFSVGIIPSSFVFK